MNSKRYVTHSHVFVFGLILLVVGMPLSRFLVSVSQIVLLLNWLVEGQFVKKWQGIRNNKLFWAFIGIYLFYVLGLFWTQDFAYGLKDLRIKLPMFWLPLLFFTTPVLEKKTYHLIMHFFVLACLIASFCSMAVYFGVLHKKIHNVREISIFESHIRFSLMLVLSISYLFFCFMYQKFAKQRMVYFFLAAWLLFFLIFLQSFTGLIILGILAVLAIFIFLFSNQKALFKFSFMALVLGGFAYIIYLVSDEYKRLNTVNEINFSTLPLFTMKGHLYYHDTIYRFTENGNYVYVLMCDEELKKEWAKRSKINYDSLDHQKNGLRYTLIRYMASKGLTKDSIGFSRLSNTDIVNIENGFPNYLYVNPMNLRTRIHQLLWEVEGSVRRHEKNGHSVTMRMEFWKTAFGIIQQHWFLGVGTGDVELAFKEQYDKENTNLQKEWQLRSHNQFLATTVALGVLGLFFFLIHLLAPLFSGKKTSLFFIFFMLIEILSFMNEDTLETQAGVTFCVFFTQLFFHNDEHNV